MSEPYISIRHLSRFYDISDNWINRLVSGTPRRILKAVDGVSFDIPKGQTFALVGESGSGKSTVGRVVVGLDRPDRGVVRIDGYRFDSQAKSAYLPVQVRQKLQMVFQSPYSSLNPRWRVGSILAEPLRAFSLISNQDQQSRRIPELLEQVGLAPQDAHKFPHEFSGGQRQRISIARALASDPEFIVCDEPTSALDVSVQAQVLNLLKRLQSELNLTYLFISHDMAVVKFMAHHIGVMRQGRIIEQAPACQLFQKPARRYTQMLIETTPRINRHHAR